MINTILTLGLMSSIILTTPETFNISKWSNVSYEPKIKFPFEISSWF